MHSQRWQKPKSIIRHGYSSLVRKQENFKYVAPMELLLNEREFKAGGPKDVVHYIPVKESCWKIEVLLKY